MLLSVLWSLCFEMPFMVLDRALLSHRNNQSNLSSKSNQGKPFVSTDSTKEIYRSTEESSSSIVQSCDEGLNRRSSEDSVYDSARNVSHQQEIYDSANCRQELNNSKDDTSTFIFVIGGSESNDSWPKVKNVHQNNGYDGDSDDASQSRLEMGQTRKYETILTGDTCRADHFRESNKMNDSWWTDTLNGVKRVCGSNFNLYQAREIVKDTDDGRTRNIDRWNIEGTRIYWADLWIFLQGFIWLMFANFLSMFKWTYLRRGS